MSIDRCVCFNITFAEMKVFSERDKLGLDAIQSKFGCGRGCGLCLPYIRAMLATGRTEFSPIKPIPGESDTI